MYQPSGSLNLPLHCSSTTIQYTLLTLTLLLQHTRLSCHPACRVKRQKGHIRIMASKTHCHSLSVLRNASFVRCKPYITWQGAVLMELTNEVGKTATKGNSVGIGERFLTPLHQAGMRNPVWWYPFFSMAWWASNPSPTTSD